MRASPLPPSRVGEGTVALLFATLILSVSFAVSADGAGRLPGPAPQPRPPGFDPVAANAACVECHTEIAAEWRGSLHQRAWEDGVFAAAFDAEPSSFCRGCHAPEQDPASDPGRAGHLGVGCVTCHVRGGDIVGTRGLSASAGHHPVSGDARLATEAACASCHEFAFPSPQRAPMQGTLREHADSAHRTKSCQGCHMPEVVGEDGRSHRGHDFGVVGRPEVLRSAVHASARRDGVLAITVTLANVGAGHAVPTGDMFRRLEIRARAEGAPPLVAKSVVLARRFARGGPGGSSRQEVGDDRLPASGAPRTVWLPFGESIEGRVVHWEVAYQRMDPSLADAFGLDDHSLEVIVAEGEVPVDP